MGPNLQYNFRLKLYQLHALIRYFIDSSIEIYAHVSKLKEPIPSKCSYSLSNMPGSTVDSPLHQLASSGTQLASPPKPMVVGLYGVPGSSKTYLLSVLKQDLERDHFLFYEGSDAIASVVPGGLDVFKISAEQEKAHWRQLAVEVRWEECADKGQATVVAGHYMFWSEEQEHGMSVLTQKDLETYTHILYLDVPAETIMQRRLKDTRLRPSVSTGHLSKWHLEEKAQLHHVCRRYGILFSLVFSHTALPHKIPTLLRDFRSHSEEFNLSRAQSHLDEPLTTKYGQVETMLVMDADRTLAAEGTGTLFWRRVSQSRPFGDGERTLKMLFNSELERGPKVIVIPHSTHPAPTNRYANHRIMVIDASASFYPQMPGLIPLSTSKTLHTSTTAEGVGHFRCTSHISTSLSSSHVMKSPDSRILLLLLILPHQHLVLTPSIHF